MDRPNAPLIRLASEDYADADAQHLAKRLRRHAEHLFTFLGCADPCAHRFENNFAERQVRPAVIIRENSLANRSDRGDSTQARSISIYRTFHVRGVNSTQTVTRALKPYVAPAQLRQLRAADIAGG